jgi:hypothetical protein
MRIKTPTLPDLLLEHFDNRNDIFVLRHGILGCSIYWTTVKSQILAAKYGENLQFEMARDHLILLQREGKVEVKRVDCGDRRVPDNPWRIMDLADPDFFRELREILLSL